MPIYKPSPGSCTLLSSASRTHPETLRLALCVAVREARQLQLPASRPHALGHPGVPLLRRVRTPSLTVCGLFCSLCVSSSALSEAPSTLASTDRAALSALVCPRAGRCGWRVASPRSSASTSSSRFAPPSPPHTDSSYLVDCGPVAH